MKFQVSSRLYIFLFILLKSFSNYSLRRVWNYYMEKISLTNLTGPPSWNRRESRLKSTIWYPILSALLYEEEFNPRREENKNSGRSWWASIPRKISRVSKSNWRGALGGRVFSPRKTCSSVPPPSVWKDVWSTFYFIIQPPLPSFCTMLRIFSKSTRV